MRDEWLIRGDVPMTKSEVRAVSLSKLELCFWAAEKKAVLYDVGAGTGSVAVEAALSGYCESVYAIEKKAEAAGLIRQNVQKFHIENRVQVVEGEAPGAWEDLETPTHAFLGGTSGNMKDILAQLLSKNPSIRVVINAVTLETVAEITDFLKESGIEAEICQLTVAKARKMGRYHLMQGQNPVYIVAFGGEMQNGIE